MAKSKIKIYNMHFGYLNNDDWNLFGICDLVIGI